MAALEVTPVIPAIRVAPETLAGMVRADRVVLVELLVQVLAAPGAVVAPVAVRELRDLRVAQVQVQPLAHQVIPVELVLMELQVIPERVEVALPVEIRVMRAAQDRRVVRVTQAQRVQEEI